jgi:uncharacterized protein (UPF0333 family)
VAYTLGAPITSLKIDAPAMVSVSRNSTHQLSLVLNAGASAEGIVWMVSNESLATVDNNGLVKIKNMAGIVTILARDPVSGIVHAIVLRIS